VTPSLAALGLLLLLLACARGIVDEPHGDALAADADAASLGDDELSGAVDDNVDSMGASKRSQSRSHAYTYTHSTHSTHSLNLPTSKIPKREKSFFLLCKGLRKSEKKASSSSSSSSEDAVVVAGSKPSLFDWSAMVAIVAVAGLLAMFHVLRQRHDQLAMAWAANMSPVFEHLFAEFPPTELVTRGTYARALCKLSDHEFELRATGRHLCKGALIRMDFPKVYDPVSLAMGFGPQQATVTVHVLIDSDRYGKYEFGFVRASHEAAVRARHPWFPPTQQQRPNRLPSEFLPVGDRNSAMLFEALFTSDLMHMLQPGRLDCVSYFLITDRFPSPDHQVVSTICVTVPDGLDLQKKEVWESHQIAVMVAVNAASRASTGDVARPVNLIRNVPGASSSSSGGNNSAKSNNYDGGAAAAAAAATAASASAAASYSDGAASDDSSSVSSSANDSKRQKQVALELAAQERREAKLRQEREKLAANPAELEKFELQLAKKKQRKQVKILRN
jgi:hypothetical protein